MFARSPRPPLDRFLLGWALLGPPIYVLAVVAGGLLWAGYSPYAESISTLTSQGAPNQAFLVPLFALYNGALVALAIVSSRTLRPVGWPRLAPIFLGTAGVSGLLLFFFPQGPWSAPLSGLGVEHTVLAGIDALCFLLAMGFYTRVLSQHSGWKTYGTVTVALLAAGIVLGGFGAASVTAPYAGAAERASIAVFLVWSELLALGLARRGNPLASAARDRLPAAETALP